jgi:hypothetical protein
MPAPAAIAAAQMHADGELGKAADHRIGGVDVSVDQGVPVFAAGGEHGLDVRVAEFRECRLVDLDIAAAGRGQRRELVAEAVHDVAPERIDILVRTRRHCGVAAAEMQRARPRNRDLGQGISAGHRLEHEEVVHVNGAAPCDPAADPRDRLRAAAAHIGCCRCALIFKVPISGKPEIGVLVHGVGCRQGVNGDVAEPPAEPAVEITMVGGAAEFSVGDDREAGGRLQPHRIGYRLGLDGGQGVRPDLARAEAAARRDQALGPQQAADVLGPERRTASGAQRPSHCGTRLSESARAAALVPV